MQGYIKLHRQLEEWEWYKNIPVKVLFLHCLLRANHKDKKWQGSTVKKGSFITSYENLAIETGLSFQQVRTAISKLKLTGELTYKSTSQYSIITINNWDEYQEDNTQINKPLTSEQQTNNKQITTNKNDKNEKNEKNDKKIEKEIKKEKELFDLFWDLCPRKNDEHKTYKQFIFLINEKEATADELIEGMKRYKAAAARDGTEERYIKKPCNWLRDRGWEDEYEEPEPQKPYVYNAFAVPEEYMTRKGKKNESKTPYIYNAFA